MPRPKKQHLKKRADGRFVCRYKNKYFMGWSEAEVLKAREEYKQQEAAGEYFAENPTVREYAERWLPLHKSDVSEKCYNDYKKQLSAMVDVIGDIPMREVTVDDAASVWKHYAGYSASTVKRAKMLCVALFETAIENDICRKNPFKARFAQPPKAPSGTHRALSPEEIDLIRNTPHRIQAGVMVMLYAGLRRGEALALTSKDIDLKANTISISKAVRFDGNRPVISAPKTAAGIRVVPILSALRPFLENVTGYLMPAQTGTVMTETAFSRAWDSYIHALTVAAGHPVNIRPHDLRHTYCTMLRDAGVDMKQAMLWMGHADEKMILHIYDHVSDQRTKNSVEQIENMLFRGQNGGQQRIE